MVQYLHFRILEFPLIDMEKQIGAMGDLPYINMCKHVVVWVW